MFMAIFVVIDILMLMVMLQIRIYTLLYSALLYKNHDPFADSMNLYSI